MSFMKNPFDRENCQRKAGATARQIVMRNVALRCEKESIVVPGTSPDREVLVLGGLSGAAAQQQQPARGRHPKAESLAPLLGKTLWKNSLML